MVRLQTTRMMASVEREIVVKAMVTGGDGLTARQRKWAEAIITGQRASLETRSHTNAEVSNCCLVVCFNKAVVPDP